MAPDHAERVRDAPPEEVRLAKLVVLARPTRGRRSRSAARARRVRGVRSSGCARPCWICRYCDRVLDLDHRSPAQLDVEAAGRDQLADLPFTQVQRVLAVPGLAAPDERVAKPLHLAAQGLVARDESQLDQRLALERGGASAGAVVVARGRRAGSPAAPLPPCGRRRRSTWKMPSWRASMRLDDLPDEGLEEAAGLEARLLRAPRARRRRRGARCPTRSPSRPRRTCRGRRAPGRTPRRPRSRGRPCSSTRRPRARRAPPPPPRPRGR